jgi:hypothetical protein
MYTGIQEDERGRPSVVIGSGRSLVTTRSCDVAAPWPSHTGPPKSGPGPVGGGQEGEAMENEELAESHQPAPNTVFRVRPSCARPWRRGEGE